MDTQALCLVIEQATKSLTPLSVSVVEANGRIGTFRIVAEGFASMTIPERIRVTWDLIKTKDASIVKKYDLAFELLAPAEDSQWNQDSQEGDSHSSGGDGIAAKDLNP